MSRRRRADRWLAGVRLGAGGGLLVALLALLGAGVLAGEERAVGILVAVEARSVGWAEAVEFLTLDGRRLRFRVDPAVDQPPGHLREHMACGEPVAVRFRRRDGALVATAILDGDAAAAAPHPTAARPPVEGAG